jgi:hypothetical protein
MEITFARINAKALVVNVIVADQDHIDSLPDSDSWVQTWGDANGEPAKAYNYAGIGFKYDAVNNAFIAPQPYPSWSLDAKFQWQPPILMPTDGKYYQWDELTKSWVMP